MALPFSRCRSATNATGGSDSVYDDERSDTKRFGWDLAYSEDLAISRRHFAI